MKLADYLFQFGVSPAKLQRELDVTPTAFRRYLTNERIPRPHILARIRAFTRGAVTYEDFADRSPPACATVLATGGGRKVIVLPWSQSDRLLDASIREMLKETRESDQLTEPLRRTMSILGPRVRHAGADMFELDGRRVDARRVVEAANAILEESGFEPIRYPGLPAKPKLR